MNSYDKDSKPYEFCRPAIDYLVSSSYQNSYDSKRELLCFVFDTSPISVKSNQKSKFGNFLEYTLTSIRDLIEQQKGRYLIMIFTYDKHLESYHKQIDVKFNESAQDEKKLIVTGLTLKVAYDLIS